MDTVSDGMDSVEKVLLSRGYPGRGCIVGRTLDGTLALVYFLTGRSVASRARTLTGGAREDILVRDTRLDAEHDDLRHYAAYVRRGSWTVLGNGDQVEPLAQDLSTGDPVDVASRTFDYEPDPPIFTPRIWMACDHTRRIDTVFTGSARRRGATDDATEYSSWNVDVRENGAGAILTTYAGTSQDVVTSGLLEAIEITALDAKTLLNSVWNSLNPELRVAALAITPEIETSSPVFIS
jgi:IMP cyclohydrolase